MSGPDSGFSGGGGGGSSRNFSSPSTFSSVWGVVPYSFPVTTGADQSISINSGTGFFTITGNLNVTTSIHCRKQKFGEGAWPPWPPLATPLHTICV